MKKLTYHLITYGCQMNKSDSERINSLLQKYKLTPTSDKNNANLIIFNACSVRQSAIDRIWGQINNLRQHNPQGRIVLTGCVLPNDKKKFGRYVDLILNIADLPKWPQIIQQQFKEITLEQFKQSGSTANYFKIQPHHSSTYQAYVPIMTGCNNFCSYCAVPYTRGREQSRPADDVIKEIRQLIKKGYKEIILLGQNVNSYQGKLNRHFILRSLKATKDPVLKTIYIESAKLLKSRHNNIINFPTLLKMIDAIPGNYWLNFVSSHPKDLSPELINCFKELKHLTPYLHLALQSGSDKIIRAMNRHYTAEDYLQLITQVRQARPDIAITTDIIVGFPGETKRDFQATAKLMRQIKFDMAYIAQYSPRPNTAAAQLNDNVPQTEKKRREKILTDILKQTALQHNQQLIGQLTDVLIEKYDRQQQVFLGHTNQFKHVKIKLVQPVRGYKKFIGQFIPVKITHATPWALEGKVEKL